MSKPVEHDSNRVCPERLHHWHGVPRGFATASVPPARSRGFATLPGFALETPGSALPRRLVRATLTIFEHRHHLRPATPSEIGRAPVRMQSMKCSPPASRARRRPASAPWLGPAAASRCRGSSRNPCRAPASFWSAASSKITILRCRSRPACGSFAGPASSRVHGQFAAGIFEGGEHHVGDVGVDDILAPALNRDRGGTEKSIGHGDVMRR